MGQVGQCRVCRLPGAYFVQHGVQKSLRRLRAQMTITDQIHRLLTEHASGVDSRSLDDSPTVLHLCIILDGLILDGGCILARIRPVKVESRQNLVQGKLSIPRLLLRMRYFDLIVARAHFLVNV